MNGKGRKKQSDSASGGAPEWMVTFSDCMTLLLTFFVLLLSFSSFDERVFRKLNLIFSGKFPSVRAQKKKNRAALLPTKQIEPTDELKRGSEKPTLDRGREETLKEEILPPNFRDRKVFLFSSANIFWGRGKTVSSEGSRILSDMAAFLRLVPNRIVISEVGAGSSEANEDFGLPRARAVLDYLTGKGKLDRARFNLSASGIAIQDAVDYDNMPLESTRIVEIALLNRSLYD